MDNYEFLDPNAGGPQAGAPPPPPPPPPPPAFPGPVMKTVENFNNFAVSPIGNINLNKQLKQKPKKTIMAPVNGMTKMKGPNDKLFGTGNDQNPNADVEESPQLGVQAETVQEFYEPKMATLLNQKPVADGTTTKQKPVKDDATKNKEDFKSIRTTMNFVYDFMANPTKNRYTNVMMFSEGNCFLKNAANPDEKYYHANKVATDHGTYIMAQAPLRNTVKTFWDMIWEQGVCIIASFCDYSNKDECHPYFELSYNKKVKIGSYVIRTEERRTSSPCIIFKIKVYNKTTKQGRIINVINWVGWEVQHIPSMSKLLAMMNLVWKMEHIVEVDDKRDVGPILVHGVSGSRRTTAFVAINILCKQLRDTQKCSVITTAVLIRKYRHNAIRDHLMFANILLAIMHFAASLNQVNKNDPNFIKATKAIISFISTSKTQAKSETKIEPNKVEVA
uniref:Protein-tyrosine phosphatase n=1 Tax=Parastrongyloides trichosuri TaxID=131310 RepID=A0A0N4ZR37_PARTI